MAFYGFWATVSPTFEGFGIRFINDLRAGLLSAAATPAAEQVKDWAASADEPLPRRDFHMAPGT